MNAAAAAAAAARQCHVVSIPYPSHGHVNAMVSFCRLLAARGGIAVTIIVTEDWRRRVLGAGGDDGGVRFATIPTVLPSDFRGFIEAVGTKMEEPAERLLEALSPAATAVVADMYLPWAVPLASRRGVPVCAFCPTPATFFAALRRVFEQLTAARAGEYDGRLPVPDSTDELWEQSVPGQPSIMLRYLQEMLSHEVALNYTMTRIHNLSKAHCVLFTSFYELEPGVLDSLRAAPPPPHHRYYAVGPCIPYMRLEDEQEPEGEEGYFAWLDSQPANSVLYVSLGTFLSVSQPQLEEIAEGLVESAVPFLWAAGDECARVQGLVGAGGAGNAGRRVVPWCQQLKVLCHPSVGGFLTHCGWNSVLEATFAGVPMLTLPLGTDQPMNSHIAVDVWKAGFSLKGGKGQSEGVSFRREVAEAVKRLMDLEAEGSREVRERALWLRDASLRAIEEGGSSCSDLNSFVNDILLQCDHSM